MSGSALNGDLLGKHAKFENIITALGERFQAAKALRHFRGFEINSHRGIALPGGGHFGFGVGHGA
jgi:hypothetical protein